MAILFPIGPEVTRVKNHDDPRDGSVSRCEP